MIPRQMPANGIPRLLWIADHAWTCTGCGESGLQPPYRNVRARARWAGDLKREHAGCGLPLALGEVGHPLNPDRQER